MARVLLGRGRRSDACARGPMATTREATAHPEAGQQRARAAPSATVVAVDRALARSSTSRASSRSYLSAPARSACPGRTWVNFLPPRAYGETSSFQFSWSLFQMTSAMGAPMVTPPRRPARNCASSVSIFWRPPRP